MTTKAKGSSVRQKLINLSAKLSVPYQNLETAFILERFVARLTADAKLSEHLVFKGGFVGLKVYNSSRYTVDVDALVVQARVDSTLERARACAETDLDDGVWFRFEDQLDLATQGEYGGIRQTYRAGIGEVFANLKRAQIVHFDVGISDPIIPEPSLTQTASLIIPESTLSWVVYPIETIIAEKMHALVAHGDLNSRSKDVYDLAFLLPRANAVVLGQALKRCFEYRKTEFPGSFTTILKSMDTKALQRGWISATASIADKPKFQDNFETIAILINRMESSF
ncbi:MAG: nucleotidyl transferase AbiEii/AbiGii toxin family protein [Acidobacteria bacterium]|nr:nucleotidyl transferase AbiEii/AbiGii toxin family protein [Acidobacteriota bacterium]